LIAKFVGGIEIELDTEQPKGDQVASDTPPRPPPSPTK